MQEQNISNRFHMQMMLPGFGVEAQHQMQQARVLVVGAGGLGCPCIQYLIAAGIGTLGVCDGDVVELSNLHRQVLFTRNDIGKKKVVAIKEKYERELSDCHLFAYDYYLDQHHAAQLFPTYDIIVDCTDDMATRYLINDASKIFSKPLVYGAIYQFQAQLAVLNAPKSMIELRDVFDEMPLAKIASCNEGGVLGVVTGLVGNMQALEVIKIIANLNGQLQNEMLICDFFSYQFLTVKISKSKNKTDGASDLNDFFGRVYGQKCKPKQIQSKQLSQEVFTQLIAEGNVQIIDVRNTDELPIVSQFDSEIIPLADLLEHPEKVSREKRILLFCHSGIRSQIALDFLTEECHLENVFHLKGGIIKWNNYE